MGWATWVINVHAESIQVSDRSSGRCCCQVSDIAWGESTINWNNKPAVGLKQAAFNVIDTTSRWYEIDLTSYVKAQKTAGKTAISLALRATTSVTPNAVFNSDEATSNRPELKITAPASAPASAVFGAAPIAEATPGERIGAWELLDNA